MSFNVAIDGPAGAGKSTVSKNLAKKLGFIYVDTGAMYRAIAYFFDKEQLPLTKESIASNCTRADVSIRYEKGEQRVILNGEDVSASIRTPEISLLASQCSAQPEVRAHLLSLQRGLAADYDVVMDGRDIGTTILPHAQVKIYLTASPKTRAMRRYAELQEKGEACDKEEILREIIARDERDMKREVSPLRKADDAVMVDTSLMDIDQVVDKLLELVKSRMEQECSS